MLNLCPNLLIPKANSWTYKIIALTALKWNT